MPWASRILDEFRWFLHQPAIHGRTLTTDGWFTELEGACLLSNRGSTMTIPVMNQNGSMIRTMMKVLAPMAWVIMAAKPAR